MRSHVRRIAAVSVFGLCVPTLFAAADRDWREGFEGAKVSWRQEQTDATVAVQVHERSKLAAHEGKLSERFSFGAGPGSVLYYSLAVPRTPLSDDAHASVYVRSNRPGVQLFARIVLPADIDPETGRPSYLLVPGGIAKSADRWERIQLTGLVESAEAQARVLRIGSNRRVSLEDAYIERLVVNLYGGAGETEVFLDEVSLGPIPEAEPADAEAEAEAKPDADEKGRASRTEAKDTAHVQMLANQIQRGGNDWFPILIDAPSADPIVLRQYGFDLLAVPADAPSKELDEAVRAGFMLVPALDLKAGIAPETVLGTIERFPHGDNVAFWNLGDDLGGTPDAKVRKEEVDRVRQVVMGLHDLPSGRSRLAFGTVSDALPMYALAGRSLDILGIEPHDWGTIRNPLETRTFLMQRREITAIKNSRALFLAWVDATVSDHAARNVWGQNTPPAWGRPQIQPEQIRLQVYQALSAGYRGIGYRADADIVSPYGLPRLMEMALLNMELQLVEPILAHGGEPIQFWNTFERDPEQLMIYNSSGAGAGFAQQNNSSQTKPQKEVKPHATIKAASIPTNDNRGRLILVADYAAGAQHQPPQMGVNDLKILVQAAENAQALEITPAGVQVLRRERTTGGVRFTIPMFSGTSMIVLTTDLSLKARLDAAVARNAPKASEFAIEQARAEIREVAEVNAQLESSQHPARDAADLINQAEDQLKSAIEAHERQDYPLSWFEARRAGRALRVLKRMHFDKAARDMTKVTTDLAKREELKGPYPWIGAITCPPLTSWQTLPEAYTWLDTIRGNFGPFGDNLIETGGFDDGGIGAMATAGWRMVNHATEGVNAKIEVVEGAGYGGKNSALRLLVTPESLDPKRMDRIIPFLDHEAAAVRTPPIPIVRDGLYRIRVLVRLNSQLPTATGGIIVRDSIGGKPYQFRATDACPRWREITLYRVAPEDGTMTVTLGLAGYSEAYFDRLRVDTVSTPASGRDKPPVRTDGPIAGRLSPPAVNPTSNPTRARR